MNRYLCQFRDRGKDYFVTDCGFDDLHQAMGYVDKVVTVLYRQVAEGQVFDYEQRQIVYNTGQLRINTVQTGQPGQAI